MRALKVPNRIHALNTLSPKVTVSRRNFAEHPSVTAKRELRKKTERQQFMDESCKGLPTFIDKLSEHKLWPLKRSSPTTLQLNVGLLCNLTCHHCHVEAGPTKKKENMAKEGAERITLLLKNTPSMQTLDITGGAPELNPHFKYLVKEARTMGRQVMDRCNLTVLLEPGMEDMADFLAENQVQIVASLPCYKPDNVDKQRGKGVFDKSMEALKKLNQLGYGTEGSKLELHLVYNPVGPHLPPSQKKLEAQYKEELDKYLGIKFNKLFTITNMPIKRYADFLFNSGEYAKYMSLLVNHFNPSTLNDVMCKYLVSVSWDGKLYDCDFNQMLDINLGAAKSHGKEGQLSIWDVDSFTFLEGTGIATARHCFGCTAGAGSSCTGAIS